VVTGGLDIGSGGSGSPGNDVAGCGKAVCDIQESKRASQERAGRPRLGLQPHWRKDDAPEGADGGFEEDCQ
jgi:hypothetical protein